MNRSHIIAAALMLFAMPAMAGDLTISGGRWNPKNSHTVDNNFNPLDVVYDSGYQLAAAVGKTSGAVRLDSELAYRKADAEQNRGKMSSLSLMFNAWFNLRNSSPFTPYVGGGIGFARGSMASPGPVDNTGSAVAYQAGAGIDFKISEGLSLDFGYRFFDTIGSTDNSNGVFKLAGTSIISGLRLRY